MGEISQVYAAGHGLPSWAAEVLERRTYAVLGTLQPDGAVHTVPLMYVFDGERFLMESRSTTRKVRNVQSDSRCRVLVQGSLDHERWIAADGRAHVVEGEDALRLNAEVVDRYLTDDGRRGWNATIAPLEDATIVLTPERWIWWDIAGMIETIAAQGYDPEEAVEWFHPLDP